MNKNLKHSKIKNTGILFELLSRQLTSDVLNNKKNSVAIRLIKEYFNEKTELGKELQLYNVLVKENYSSEGKAEKLVEAVVTSRQKLRNANLRREKYNLIKEIKNEYDLDSFFAARVPNYKVFASIYKLFLSETSNDVFDPVDRVNSRYSVIEHVTRTKVSEKTKEKKVVSEYKKQEKDLRLLAYKIYIEKFNSKYDTLNEAQKKLLREYINNISNTTHLREFVNMEIDKVKSSIEENITKVDDKITRIKLEEVVSHIDDLKKGTVVKDGQFVSLMRYYQLDKEIKNTLSKKENVNG